jgi:hypothetical protein
MRCLSFFPVFDLFGYALCIMKTTIFLLILLSLSLNLSVFGQSSSDERSVKARQVANRIGTGRDAKVEVKLLDKTSLKGYIGSIAGDKFSLVDEKSGSSRDIAFSDVDKLKKRGGGLSIGAWIGIGAAAAGAAVLIGFISIRCRNEPGSC